ncbi:MAG TPA: hypothetical protein DCQ31_18455, partial [Bacteroidales bacterium]|nr:hypothetical protein [Bacteroidales bacterium]
MQQYNLFVLPKLVVRNFSFFKKLSLSIVLSVLLIGFAQGQADNSYRAKQSGNWNNTNTWERYNLATTAWVAAVATPSNTNSPSINIPAAYTVTVTANVNIDQATIDGIVAVNSGITLTVANGGGTDLTVNSGGTLLNAGTIATAGATVTMNAGSTYEHTQNGGTIPTAAWNATATCLVSGVTTTVPAGINQNFG